MKDFFIKVKANKKPLLTLDSTLFTTFFLAQRPIICLSRFVLYSRWVTLRGQPRPQGFSLKKWVGRKKALASAGHVSPRTP